jgi:hypothetical protein
MGSMHTTETFRDAQRVKTNKEELVERIGRTLSEDGAKEVFPGFFLARASRPSESLHTVLRAGVLPHCAGQEEGVAR